MGHAAIGGEGQHRSGETEEAAKLSPMVEVKQELLAPSAGFLKVLITWPEMRCCKVWPPFCFLEAYIGGELVASKMLPMERESEALERKEMDSWRQSLSILMGFDWPSLSLELLVQRVDYVPYQRDLHLIRGGTHTSRYEAVIGRAQVKLVDALLIGDEEEEEVEEEEKQEDRKKRCREETEGYLPRLEGTLEYNKIVTLNDWVMTAPLGTADSVPRPVRCGTVNVRMTMFHHG